MLPARAIVPAHGLAHRLDDARNRFAQRVGIREDLRHRMLDRLALLRLLVLGDVLADAAITPEAALRVEHRLAADADPAELAVGAGAQILEIVERLVRQQRALVRLPLRIAHPVARHLPARLAHVAGGADAGALGKPAQIRGEAEVLVLLPVPIGGEAQQAAETIFALGRGTGAGGKRLASGGNLPAWSGGSPGIESTPGGTLSI